MAETKTAEQTSSEEKNGSDGNSTRKSAVKAAAIAAASGATALAAKKAFSDRGPSRDREEKTARREEVVESRALTPGFPVSPAGFETAANGCRSGATAFPSPRRRRLPARRGRTRGLSPRPSPRRP